MRILHCFKGYRPNLEGGVIEVIHQLGVGAIERGHQVRVLVRGPERAVDNQQGIEVIREPLWPAWRDVGLTRAFVRRFQDLASTADIVHYHGPWPTMEFVQVLHPPSVPTVMTYHSDLVGRNPFLGPCRFLQRSAVRSVDAVVATSDAYARSSRWLRDCGSTLRTIPIGIDPSRVVCASADRVEQIRRQVGAPFILFVGVLRSYKGLMTLVEAARLSRFPLVVAGDGPLRKELARASNQLSQGKLRLLGSVSSSERSAWLQACAGLVLPSEARSEAFGVVLLEAAAHARPQISTEIGTGTSWVNLDGQTGFVVPPRNPRALAAAIDQLCSDKELSDHLGMNALKRLHSLFTRDQMVDAYLRLYESLIAAAAARRPSRDASSQTPPSTATMRRAR